MQFKLTDVRGVNYSSELCLNFRENSYEKPLENQNSLTLAENPVTLF